MKVRKGETEEGSLLRNQEATFDELWNSGEFPIDDPAQPEKEEDD